MFDTFEKVLDFLNLYPSYVKFVAAVTLVSLVILVLMMVFVQRQNPESRTLFIKDLNELWKPLADDLRAAKPSQKRLDLLGLTLYSAWGELLPWIQ